MTLTADPKTEEIQADAMRNLLEWITNEATARVRRFGAHHDSDFLQDIPNPYDPPITIEELREWAPSAEPLIRQATMQEMAARRPLQRNVDVAARAAVRARQQVTYGERERLLCHVAGKLISDAVEDRQEKEHAQASNQWAKERQDDLVSGRVRAIDHARQVYADRAGWRRGDLPP